MSIHGKSEQIESSPPVEYRLPGAKPGQTGLPRNVAIDFTKGTLVLFMVLYHWLNYFVGTQGQYYNYFRFLTPSFIFISGFMISQIHLPRYENSDLRLPKRLFVRGFKLLVVFCVLNALVGAVLSRALVPYSGFGESLRSLCWAAFVAGNPSVVAGQKSVAFNILVPIAYLLILSAGLVLFTRHVRHASHYTLCLLVVAVVVLNGYEMGNLYLDLLMAGVLGVVMGFAGSEQIGFVVSHPYILSVMYGFYLAVITVWDVTLPLQVASAILTMALLYIAGSRKAAPGAARRYTILLGKYSLLGYISQIAILQGLRRSSLLFQHGVGVLAASLVLGALLTVMVVKITDVARRKSRLADNLYRLVFA